MSSVPSASAGGEPAWQEITAPYRKPDPVRSWWQVINSLVPYAVLWYLMYRSLEVSYWLTLALAIPAVGFLIRIFIIHHDCGHGAFFRSRRLSEIVGFVTGVLTFTAFRSWRRGHALHHATSGDLDRRSVGGEVWTLTVEEYLEAPRATRLAYRVYRNPIVMFVLGPLYLFLVSHRFAYKSARWRERWDVWRTNLAIAGLVVGLGFAMGFEAYILIQLPIIWIGGSLAIWLFYVQHQFESVYWERHESWEYVPAAVHGSSFYKLPALLQWFTGNIGYHHIHHLNPRIPNYYLQRCHDENPTFATIPVITLRASLRSATFRLWDEKRRRMVGFGYLRRLRRQGGTPA